MNQSKFLAITCNSFKPREKSRVHSAIGFGFASHWLKNWRESFKPITKRSNRNHVITFDSHLKTALDLKPSRDFIPLCVVFFKIIYSYFPCNKSPPCTDEGQPFVLLSIWNQLSL